MSQPEAPKITFPCDDYVIKVVGDEAPQFRSLVESVLKQFDPGVTQASFSENASKNGRFVSLTVRMRIEQESHLTDLFEQLKTSPLVKMVI